MTTELRAQLSDTPTPRTDALLLIVNEGRVYADEGPIVKLSRQLERELAAAQKELEAMRFAAAYPMAIGRVRDELGPLSLWTQTGLEAEIQRRLSAAQERNARLVEALEMTLNCDLIYDSGEAIGLPRTGKYVKDVVEEALAANAGGRSTTRGGCGRKLGRST